MVRAVNGHATRIGGERRIVLRSDPRTCCGFSRMVESRPWGSQRSTKHAWRRCSRRVACWWPSSRSTPCSRSCLRVACELTGRAVRRDRGARRRPPRAAALRHAGRRPGRARADRRSAARPRHPRRADPPSRAAAARRRQRSPALVRVPRTPSADAHVPRRAGADPGRAVGQPVPHGEGRRAVRRGRRDCRGDPRRLGRAGGRERPPVRGRGIPAGRRPSAPSAGSRRPPRSPARSAARRTSTACSS